MDSEHKMSRLIVALWLVISTSWAAANAVAADDTDALLAVLNRIESMQGRFQQYQYDESDSLIGESYGRFRLLRPGYFSWEIESPDSQLIVADPQYIWHYDRDLETATRRPVDDSERMSPLQVLGGNEAVLRSNFTVVQTTQNTFSLHPKGISPGFQRLLLSFSDNGLEGLEIADNLSQRVVIVFESVDTESRLGPEDFSFTPPEGVDLFYYDQ